MDSLLLNYSPGLRREPKPYCVFVFFFSNLTDALLWVLREIVHDETFARRPKRSDGKFKLLPLGGNKQHDTLETAGVQKPFITADLNFAATGPGTGKPTCPNTPAAGSVSCAVDPGIYEKLMHDCCPVSHTISNDSLLSQERKIKHT